MTFTYTSADLVEIVDEIPGLAGAAGLAIIPGVEIVREADVEISAFVASIEDALRVAVLANAPFITMETETFWASRIRATEGYDDLPAAAERMLKAAEEHDGSLVSVEVRWVADGLAYQWTAQTEWIGPLLMKIDAAKQAAEDQAEAEDDARTEEYYANIRAMVTALVESPKYRREQVTKRRHIAPGIIAAAGLGEVNEVLLTHRIIPEANKIVNAKAVEFEEDFRSRKRELAIELSNVEDFYMQNTKAGKKLAAIEFLIEKADGHRFLNSNFATELTQAASAPRNIRRL
ncbi:hypothetical protein [Arthrobacter sp. NicSoilC5]|uniref:hypothetical protein n=1 Tax=Arthrobacter sp. NicSoilC5 TaxID=2831000 RepID=UPI001CC67DA1|nr:hypothetical protein [Arthrobacter sp. NicSoilC5]BCW78321.1 hypothetical protein NicSoilC5_03400 [Arthrobacter sp. NicSoilC5]